MAYRGVVRNGKIELEPPATLPEGTRVTVEVVADEWDDWLAEAKKLAEDITKKTPPGVSIVEELIKSRR